MSDQDSNRRRDDEDLALFRQAMANVRRLRNDRIDPRPAPPAPRPRQAEADDRAVMEELLEPPSDPALVETGEELLFCRPGVQKRVLQRLRRGHYPPAAHLDLHGFTRREAYRMLADFLAANRSQGQRCVRVVHGKGRGSGNRQPVLKAAVDQWLRRRDDVMAFASTPANDGGTGAVYVLLRSLRAEDR